jgi:hypothetical protein
MFIEQVSVKAFRSEGARFLICGNGYFAPTGALKLFQQAIYRHVAAPQPG